MSAYEFVHDAIAEVIPDTWRFIGYETPNGPVSPDAPTVELKLRSGRPMPQAPIGHWRLDWIVTLTTEYTDREVAEPVVADQALELIELIDGIGVWIACTEFTKALNEDGRLAADITVQTHTTRDTPEEPPAEEEEEG